MLYPAPAYALFDLESRLNGAAPGVVRPNGRAVVPADSIRLRNRMLKDRTEDEWIRLIGEIEDDNLRLAIAKKIYWDIFTVRHWAGLDDVVHEPGTRIVRYFCRHTAPEIRDIRIALWQLGYPVSTIRVFYPDDTTFTFFRVQARPSAAANE